MGAERFPCPQFGNFDKKNRRFHSQYLVSLFQSRITTTFNISIWSNLSSRDDRIFLNEHCHSISFLGVGHCTGDSPTTRPETVVIQRDKR
jgi:hypothetical protein